MGLPKVGSRAPDFELADDKGNQRRLSDFGGKPLILYFYPKDDTPGCVKEACSFRDDYGIYVKAGIQIVGVSPDDPKSHTKFRAKYDLPFPLLADEGHVVSQAYGVWGNKRNFGREYMGVHRTTFVIDSAGKISHVFENVDPGIHSKQLLSALGAQPES